MKISQSVLRAKIYGITQESSTQKEAAAKYDISPQYLSDILSGRRDISDDVAQKFGWRQDERHFVKVTK